jgi:hypothetical protein
VGKNRDLIGESGWYEYTKFCVSSYTNWRSVSTGLGQKPYNQTYSSAIQKEISDESAV